MGELTVQRKRGYMLHDDGQGLRLECFPNHEIGVLERLAKLAKEAGYKDGDYLELTAIIPISIRRRLDC